MRVLAVSVEFVWLEFVRTGLQLPPKETSSVTMDLWHVSLRLILH